jgi:hypothetical protein
VTPTSEGQGQIEAQLVGATPNRFERTVRVVRDVAATVALILVSVLMALMLGAVVAIGKRISDLGGTPDPAPAATGCPFGPNDCGG